ncbi:MAG: hypothetical protein K2N38_11905, partial [Oscillospiraceae bacterium]|nr:hypothetical protein [Oscillospiraceae bacterium]
TVSNCKWLGGSNAFDFMIKYQSIGGDFTDLSLTVSECREASSSEDPEPKPGSAEPIFKISASGTSEIVAGEKDRFTLELANLGSVDATGVLIEVTPPEEVVLLDGSASHDINMILAGSETSIAVKYKALDRITSAKQTFNVTMRYYYYSGDSEMIGTSSASISLPAKVSSDGSTSAEPLFKITPTNIAEIKSSQEGYFTVELKNLGKLEAKRVLVETSASEDVILTDGSGSQDIASIKSNGTASVRITYKALSKVNSAKQVFNVSLHYYYEGAGGETIGSASYTVNVPAAVEELAEVPAPSIKITGQTLSVPVTAGKEYEYSLTVRNFSDTPADDVYLFLDASDSLYFIDGTETVTVGSIAAKGSAKVKIKFRTVDTIGAVKQGITANISYTYIDGGVKKNGQDTSSVTIIASGTNGGDTPGSGIAVPNIIIKSYDIGEDQIAAGSEFNLNLDLFNTSGVTGVENVIMTINAGGSINIFGGTNTFYYPNIGADAGISESVPLRALPTAETGTSSVSVSLKYDYIDNGTRSTASLEQTIFVPVYQPDKMTFEVNIPTWGLMVGQDVYITTTYLNKGRSEISNVKAEIVGDVSALSTSKVIGTVQPGGNGSFDFIVTPMMGGPCEFTILMTYEDATLTEIQKELPVSFEVEDMWSDPGFEDPWMDPGFEDPGMEEGSKFPWLLLWIGIGVVVVGGVVTIIIVVHHKKKKKKALTEDDIDWEDEFEDKKTNDTTKV